MSKKARNAEAENERRLKKIAVLQHNIRYSQDAGYGEKQKQLEQMITNKEQSNAASNGILCID